MNLIFRYRWMVILYSYYTEQPSYPDPIILYADDLMYNPEAVAEFCEQLGLNPKNTKYQWPNDTKVGVVYAKEDLFIDTLAASASMVPGKSSQGVDVEVEMAKWTEEFGNEIIGTLRRHVDDAMEDYLFLRSRGVGAMIDGRKM